MPLRSSLARFDRGVAIPKTLAVLMGFSCGCSPPPGPVAMPAAPQSQEPPSNQQDAASFTIEDVRFQDKDNVLAGVLVSPTGPGPHPAIAFVYGSDPVDRTYGGTGPALWAHFARHGFACLAWDKPGVGRSTGDWNAQTLRDRADEALAAVRFLRGRDGIRRDQVGLWGHSQGGIVAPLAASLSDDVAFIIEVGGAQIVAWQQDALRVEAQLRADGFPEADIEKATAFARMRMDLIRGNGPFEDLEKANVEADPFPWFQYVGRCDRKLFYWARNAVEYDPGLAWEKVHCPVLAIYGEKDTSLPAEKSLPIIRRGLETAGNHDVTIKLFPRADHSITVSDTGGKKEARERAKTRKPGDPPDFAPGYLDAMTTWLAERFKPGP